MIKRLLAICLLICLLLCGCEKTAAEPTAAPTTAPTTTPYDPEDNGPTSPPLPEPHPEAAIGAVLDIPDAAGYPEWLTQYEQYRLEVTDYMGFEYVYAYRYSFATNETEHYEWDGYQEEETVWYAHGDQINQYVSDGGSPFVHNTNWDANDYAEDIAYFDNNVNIFLSFTAPVEGVHYVKLKDVDAPTGPACAYEIYENNELTGYLWIDKATGIMVRKMDTQINNLLQVTALSMEKADIPTYK